MARVPSTGIGNGKQGTHRRVQLDFSQKAYERLARIVQKAEARTNAEVIRDALRIYDWFLDQKSHGYHIQLAKDDEVKEVELLF